jgi:hypothetical protein
VKRKIDGHSQDNILGGNENFTQNSCAAFQIFLDESNVFQSAMQISVKLATTQLLAVLSSIYSVSYSS